MDFYNSGAWISEKTMTDPLEHFMACRSYRFCGSWIGERYLMEEIDKENERRFYEQYRRE